MRCGLIGAGVVGSLRAEALGRVAGAELVAVADVDLDRARTVASAASGGSAKASDDHRSVLEIPGIDAVVVSTPVHLHAEHVIDALESGKHVLCEKPLSNDVDSCRRMVAAAERAGRVLATGFNYRYFPAVKFLKRAVDEGRIGRLEHLRAFGGHDGLDNFRADWMYRGELSGGGAMMDIGLHVTDLVRFVAGEVGEVYGRCSEGIWRVQGSEDGAMAIFETVDGVPVAYQATWTEWKGYRFWLEAYGDRGMVRAFYAPMFNLLITRPEHGGKRSRRYKLYPTIVLREKLQGWEWTTRQAFAEELVDFRRRIEGEEVPLADGYAGQRAVEIADAVYRSSRDGRPVSG